MSYGRRARWSATIIAVALAITTVLPAAAEPHSSEIRSDLEAAQARLDELEHEIGGVVDDYNAAQEALTSSQEDLDAAEARIRDLETEAAALREALEQHVRRLHKLGPSLELSSAFARGGPSEAGARLAAIRRIVDGHTADLEAFAATGVALGTAREQLERQRDEANEQARQLETRRAEVEATIAEKQAEIDRLNQRLRAALDREAAERRAAEERRRQRQAEAARAAGGGSGASTTSTRAVSTPAPAARGNAQVAVQAALSKLGTPYRWGATGPNSFDCSGLMVWAWQQAGVSLPRTSAGQFASLRPISRSELQPGDLVFAGSPRVHHVAMYIGGGQVVHAPYTGAAVSIRSMERPDLRGFARPGV